LRRDGEAGHEYNDSKERACGAESLHKRRTLCKYRIHRCCLDIYCC
jgi:hypothetical protein